ncbi:ATP-binding region, ATPase-like:Stage II sporulation E [Cupriavidus oxalaticus]|uniref:ATP-binding region, ATPase-like:Stage II sporulation E n=2 Tax=Cupriavidus oxalaticus TaxID=96344 RepID=A0A375FQ19_9BURK|nr:ATP-binding region, ATPase-like:Stage II sporulation E [Cupriavidus oxalaticus]SPC24380.1 ATP-binding region, ATPase-like:Stage II sporulation E [Cupriavidus oxalaticus]
MSVSLGGSSEQGPAAVLPMDDASRVGEARRLAADLCARLAFDSVLAGRIAVVANELSSNLVRHAVGGRMLIGARAAGDSMLIELISLDNGPGMRDPQACMRDGYSSAGSAGQGLGAVQRMADDFDIVSRFGQGSVILARFYRDREPGGCPVRAAPVRGCTVGAVYLAAPGEQVSGDGWAIAQHDGGADVVLADGLGHGPLAADAARAALAAFAEMPCASPSQVVERAHAALRSTRGAAVSAARLDLRGNQIHFAGAGNVMGRVVSGTADRTLLPQHGTPGIQVRAIQEQVMDWPAYALVILFSDGVQSRWQLDDASLLRHDPTVIAAFIVWKFGRGRDDATVLVIRRAED